jgi:hypothetical protein
VIDRPLPKAGDPSENLTDWQQKIAVLIRRLTDDVPLDIAERNTEQHAKWLLAYTLDWHRREEKSVWWEYFRLCDLSAEDLLEERAALSGLSFINKVGGTAKTPIDGSARRRRSAQSGRCKIWQGRSDIIGASHDRHQEAAGHRKPPS